MRELIISNDLGQAIRLEFNEKTSEIYIHGGEDGSSWVDKIPPEETAKLQNWFLSL